MNLLWQHPHLQASPSSSSLSSTHSAPSQMINSAPSTIRGEQLRRSSAFCFVDTNACQCFTQLCFCVFTVGSPSLPDKYRHNREMLMLLPPHRERPSSAMYTNITENGQVRGRRVIKLLAECRADGWGRFYTDEWEDTVRNTREVKGREDRS